MLNYIVRRLLLMIPTLFGITFLVFMIIALSPGGLSAGLQLGAGGAQQQGEGGAAVQEAYLEDRYGLDQPAPVQYLRWLGGISPINFSTRQQIRDRERLSTPRPLELPRLIELGWITPAEILDASVQIAAPVDIAELAVEERRELYDEARESYANTRGDYIRARTGLELAAIDYAEAAGISAAIESPTELRAEVLARTPFDTSNPLAERMAGAASRAMQTYETASRAREQVAAIFATRPYPPAGIGIDGFWLGMPDLGSSFTRSQPVVDLIAQRLPVTMLLNLLAIPVIYLIAIPAGVIAATRKDTLVDTLIGALFVALWAMPRVGVGVIAIGYLASRDWMASFGLPHFPTGGLHSREASEMLFLPSIGPEGFEPGYLLDLAAHLFLPIVCIAYSGFAVLSKQTRAAMLENFNADFVRTARAKGVAPSDVTLYHVFRNSLLPLITMFVSIFPAMFAGSIVIEEIFTIDGMGKLAIDAIRSRDREVLLGTTLMVTIVNLLALLLADILYAVADPRVSYD